MSCLLELFPKAIARGERADARARAPRGKPTVKRRKETKRTPQKLKKLLLPLTVSASVPVLATLFLGRVSGSASSTASSRSPEPLPDSALTGIGSTPDCHASAMAAAARAELSHFVFVFFVCC